MSHISQDDRSMRPKEEKSSNRRILKLSNTLI